MKYLIRIFVYNEEEVFAEYEFDHLPYMPHVNEIMMVDDVSYVVTEIISSFDQLSNGQFMIDYIIREVC